MVKGSINGAGFESPLEPDGNWSHWLKLDKELMTAAAVKSGDRVSVSLIPINNWTEPLVPSYLKKSLAASPKAHQLWIIITPLARWEWVRWIRSTANTETRNRRVKVAISKLESGERRPCCWNRNLCTEPEVSKNGILLA
jgi:hypothetical protein